MSSSTTTWSASSTAVVPTTTHPPPVDTSNTGGGGTTSSHNTTGASNTSNSSSNSSSNSHIQYRRSTRTALYVGSNYISNSNSHDPTITTKPTDSSVVVFPRRWPGIGASFQCTKIPPLLHKSHSNYVHSRPAPLRMSLEYPHCTMADVEKETSIAAQTTEDRNGYETGQPTRKRPRVDSVDISDHDEDNADEDDSENGSFREAHSIHRHNPNGTKTPLQIWSQQLITWYTERSSTNTNESLITDAATTTTTSASAAATMDSTESNPSRNDGNSLFTVELSSTRQCTNSNNNNKTYHYKRPYRKRSISAKDDTLASNTSNKNRENHSNNNSGSSISTPLPFCNITNGFLERFRKDKGDSLFIFKCDDVFLQQSPPTALLDPQTALSNLTLWNYRNGRRAIKRQRRRQAQQDQQQTINTIPNTTGHALVLPPFESTKSSNENATIVTTTNRAERVQIDSLQLLPTDRSKTSISGSSNITGNTGMLEPNVQLQSWCKQTIRNTVVSCSGDYRKYSTIRKYIEGQPQQYDLGIAASNPYPMEDSNNMAILQNAMYACAKELLQHIRCGGASSKTTRRPIIYISYIWQFLYFTTQLCSHPEMSVRITDDVKEEQTASFLVHLNELYDVYTVARWHYAHLLDLWGEQGVDVETIEKHIDTAKTNCQGIVIDFLDEMQRELNKSIQWQKKVDRAYQQLNTMDDDNDRNDLCALQELHNEGKLHGIRSKACVLLENKIERVLNLQNRIMRWRESATTRPNESKETIKFTMALVRDIHRFKVRFPIGNEMILFQQDAESWVERANIAIRSRISLQEINALIDRGLEMPLDLSEFIEKLQSRASMAMEWMRNFEDIIPCPQLNGDRVDTKALIARIRFELDSKGGRSNSLNHLSLEGSRLPVEIDIAKLLHIELDARAWTMKTKKFLPGTSDDGSESEGNRKGKIEDLRDHVAKAKVLRDRLELTVPEKEAWVLDGEMELLSIVDAADKWLLSNREIIEGDCDEPVSIEELQSAVANGNAVFANLGSGAAKLSRVLNQAENWYQQHYPLFVRCNLRKGNTNIDSSTVKLSDLKKAIEDCDVSIPLAEVAELQTLVDKVEDWCIRASQAKASKANLKRSQLLTMDDLTALIDESTLFHVDISAEVTSLQAQCDDILDWRGQAANEILKITVAFQYLRETLNESFGPASEYQRAKVHDRIISSRLDAKICSDQESIMSSLSRTDGKVHLLIKSFLASSNVSSCVVTPESELALFLEEVFCWCMQSIIYLQNQHLVFDKKYFTTFDRFIMSGKMLCSSEDMSDITDELRLELTTIISDQQSRLDVLVADRGSFLAWCKKAENLLQADDRRPSLAKIIELDLASEEFPSSCDVVQKVRSIASKGTEWTRVAKNAINASGNEKMSMQDAKSLLDEGEALGFVCEELKMLRNGIRAARGWSNKVKRAKLEEGGMEHDEMEALVEEHDALIVNMGDDAIQLQTSMKRYCICRRAMHSFMIACDECNDWFHGPCVGISEKRAVDRVPKYVCLRCSLSKTYKASTMTCVNIIRKWVSTKEMKKFRQAENQKQKRKIRKESKDIETFQAEILALHELLKCQNYTMTDDIMNSHERESINEVPKPQLVVDIADVPTDTVVAAIDCIGRVVNDDPTNCSTLDKDVATDDMPVVGHVVSDDPSTLDKNVATDEMSVAEDLHDTKNMNDATLCTNPIVDVKIEAPKLEVPCTMPTPEVIHEEPQHSTNDNNPTSYPHHKNLSRDGIEIKLAKLHDAVKSARLRIIELEEIAAQQKVVDNEEFKMAAQLRFWVIRVRSLVLFPSTLQLAALSKPNTDGSISDSMRSVIRDAELLGIQNTCDVKAVTNAFHRMAWCLVAISIFKREPTATQIEKVINLASKIDLQDEKSIRTIKLLAQRVSSWQSKVEKALAPVPGETRPYNLEQLQLFLTAGGDIPVYIPIEQRLTNVVEDKGTRYCLCGGPSDGRFMVSCDKCDRWFHGHCVKVNATEKDLKDWTCPQCKGQIVDEKDLDLERFHENFDVADDEEDEHGADSTKNSLSDKLWPPYGLFGSHEATEILGDEVCKYQDSLDELVPEAIHSFLKSTAIPSMATFPYITNSIAPTNTLLSTSSLSVGYCGDTKVASLLVENATNNPVITLPIFNETLHPAALGFGSQNVVPTPEVTPTSMSDVDDIAAPLPTVVTSTTESTVLGYRGKSDELNGIHFG